MKNMILRPPAPWLPVLDPEFSKHYYQNLESFISNEYRLKTIYPEFHNIFNALNNLKPHEVKAIIIGQDPYHGENQAHGLSFSVQRGVNPPPSLRNIFKELESDLGFSAPDHGCLEYWRDQGVLLLNTVLTVSSGQAGSHQKRGWETVTDTLIKYLSENGKNIVFILWGAPAQKKEILIDCKNHLILKAPHPSPLSSYRGFFGSQPFSTTNKYLKRHNRAQIDWSIPH